LPSPIFPESMYPAIRQCPQPSSDPSDISSITYIRENILSQLAPCVYILLGHILRE
jgi:Rho GTPase-activating protein 1